MESPNKITILLADEDALRRDGLAAVLEGTGRFEILAHCPDGEVAMERMRELRPDVAVVDLNLPKPDEPVVPMAGSIFRRNCAATDWTGVCWKRRPALRPSA